MRESRTDETGMRQTPTQRSASERRGDSRLATDLRATLVSVDPVPDGASARGSYWSSDADAVENASRRGICLHCERPPAVGTRLVLELFAPGETRPIDLVGRARWTRVEFQRGSRGARALAKVGVEIMGGSPTSLDRWDRALEDLAVRGLASVATPEGLR
jgi:hypothetical protein